MLLQVSGMDQQARAELVEVRDFISSAGDDVPRENKTAQVLTVPFQDTNYDIVRRHLFVN